MKKYELTDDCIEVNGHQLYRIKSVLSFGDVEEGRLGGYIEREDNLSHDGNCWVDDLALVYDNAVVRGDAIVHRHAEVFDRAFVCDNAKVCDSARVYGDAYVGGVAHIHDNADVYGCAVIRGNISVGGNAEIGRDAVVCKIGDYFTCINAWSSCRSITWTRYNGLWHTGCFYGTSEELIAKALEDMNGAKKAEYFKKLTEFVNML